MGSGVAMSLGWTLERLGCLTVGYLREQGVLASY